MNDKLKEQLNWKRLIELYLQHKSNIALLFLGRKSREALDEFYDEAVKLNYNVCYVEQPKNELEFWRKILRKVKPSERFLSDIEDARAMQLTR